LGATASVGNMQKVRDAAKPKQATSFKVFGQSAALNAFYNALQVSGGATDAVRHAARPQVVQFVRLCRNGIPIFLSAQFCFMQTFAAPHGASDPLRKVATLLGVDMLKPTWRGRLSNLWIKELRQHVQHPGEA
jgi:hypothetical protein